MIKKVFLTFFVLLFTSCVGGSSDDSSNTQIDFRNEMRKFVISISEYAKSVNPDFIVIPQNGVQLITENGEPDGKLVEEYVKAIDGQAQEDLFYGFKGDNIPTPLEEVNWLTSFLDRLVKKGKKVLVINYCWDENKINDAYQKSYQKGYISIATCRELNCIPPYPPYPYNKNDNDIFSIQDAKNFLYLINPENFPSKEAFLTALENTYYDVLIIDAFFNGNLLSKEDVNRLNVKPNGARRLVIAYMSIGEAEDYRYYWKDEWKTNPPDWLDEENPDWPGNYKVKYWNKEWQSIIYGNENSYLQKILNAGFDGVYLDIIDAFEYFEGKSNK